MLGWCTGVPLSLVVCLVRVPSCRGHHCCVGRMVRYASQPFLSFWFACMPVTIVFEHIFNGEGVIAALMLNVHHSIQATQSSTFIALPLLFQS